MMSAHELDQMMMVAITRSVVFAGLAVLMVMVFRRCMSAHSASVCWKMVLAGSVLVPLVSVCLPGLPLVSEHWMPGMEPATAIVEEDALMSGNELILDPVDSVQASVAQPEPASIWLWVWIGGVAVTACWFLMGHARVFQVRRSASSFERAHSLKILPDRTKAMLSSHVHMPMSCGLLQPMVVFPQEARGWDDDKLSMVLAHEASHVRRMDLMFHVLASVGVSLLWMNPLMWFALRQLRVSDEQVADDAVLERGAVASEYAIFLYEVARARQVGASGMAASYMAKRSMLGNRIRALMDEGRKSGLASWRVLTGVGAMTSLLVVAVGTLTVREAAAEPPSPAFEQPALQGEVAVEKEQHNADEGHALDPVTQKLRTIIIPTARFENTTLEDAVEFLRLRSQQLDKMEQDPAKKGVNFVIRKLPGKEIPRIDELWIRNVPLEVLLYYVCEKTHTSYKVDKFAVILSPKLEE